MKMRWKVTILLGCLILSAAVVFASLTFWVWYPGVTPRQTARILVDDRKFGMRALGMAHFWGDRILVPLREVSEDFTLLDNRNSFWVAELLARDNSSASLEISYELYKKSSIYQKLVGAVGLAAHGKLPSAEFLQSGFIYDLLTNDKYISAQNDKRGKSVDITPVELALVVAKYARNERSVPLILALINKRPCPGVVQWYACEALGEIGDKSAIPVLDSAMEADDFYALPEAFRALIKLGDEKAVPLAIRRISPKISPFLVKALEAHTGKKFGFDRHRWEQWWEKDRAR
jgi:hypothetical protein